MAKKSTSSNPPILLNRKEKESLIKNTSNEFREKNSQDLAKQLGARSIGQRLMCCNEQYDGDEVINDAVVFGKNAKSFLTVKASPKVKV